MPGRFVVSLRLTGLGDLIICLGAAWRFARNTGRTLVADWRFSFYASEGEKNLFPLCFEPSDELAGVPFIGDDRVENLLLPAPRYPSVWNDDAFMSQPYLCPIENGDAERIAAVELIRGGRDVEAATVVFDGCINDGLVSLEDARTFLGALRPVPAIAEAVDRFRKEHFGAQPVIGLHIRHGNGGDIMGHALSWRSFASAMERCESAVRRARAALGDAAAVLLCTDSVEVERAIRERIRGVICRPKSYRRAGEGELHGFHGAFQGRDDALVEMILLSHCDALIRFPSGSFFSFYAAAMMRNRSVPGVKVYDLMRSCDPDVPFSPTLLL